MTRRERWGFTWFVLVCCVITGTINWAIAQPQPAVSPRVEFDLIRFENGSAWYVRKDSIQAMWAVPRDEQEKLGYKSKLYGAGFQITAPMELHELLKSLLTAEKEQVEEMIEQLELVP